MQFPIKNQVFYAYGQVRLRGVRIHRNLHLGGGRFEPLPRLPSLQEPQDRTGKPFVPGSSGRPDDERELVGWFHSAKVDGTTFLTELDRPPVRFYGSVSFTGLRTDVWEDSLQCWSQCRELDTKRKPTFELNGLVYKSLRGPTLGEERLVWLLHQPMADLSGRPKLGFFRRLIRLSKPDNDIANSKFGFKTQPWEQCARTLYDLGYISDARKLFRMEQRFLRLKGRPRFSERFLSFMLGTFVGHGYNFSYTVAWALWLFLLSWVVADVGYREGYIVHVPMGSTRTAATTPAESQSDYPQFRPLLYAFDMALPTGDLRQMKFWIANDVTSAASQAAAEREPPPSRLVSQANTLFSWLIFSWTDPLCDTVGESVRSIVCATPDVAKDRPEAIHPDPGLASHPEPGRLAAAGTQSTGRSVVGVALIYALLATALGGYFLLLPAATFRFPKTPVFSRKNAMHLYGHVLNKERNCVFRFLPPALAVIAMFVFFFVRGLYFLKIDAVKEGMAYFDAITKQVLGLSFVHFWGLFETTMGLMLLTAVTIGLGTAAFRRRD